MAELRQIAPVEDVQIQVEKYRTPEARWEEVVEALYGDARVPVNVVYTHRKGWDRDFWGIQNINDQVSIFGLVLAGKQSKRPMRFGFWTIVGLLAILADLVWIFIRGF